MGAPPSFLACGAEAEEQELVARHLEAGDIAEIGQAGLHFAGMHFHRAAAGFALKVVVMVVRVAADEPHGLVGAEDGLGPALLHEALEIAVDGGNPGTMGLEALPDILHGKGAV